MRPRGFTLVELLAVIAILTLLAGLLFPVLRTSRERARASVCGSKVKQLLLGLRSYELDQETFPPGCEPAETSLGPFAGSPVPGIDIMGRWWFDFSQKVDHGSGDGLEVLKCPSKRQANSLLERDILVGNYGANLSLCRVEKYMRPYAGEFSGKPLSTQTVSQPGSTLLLVDSGYALVCWWHVTESPPVTFPDKPSVQNATYVPGLTLNKEKVLWPGQTRDALEGRHPDKTVNIGFVDGHVDRRQADELRVEQTGEGEWSNSPLWRPQREPVSAPTPSPSISTSGSTCPTRWDASWCAIWRRRSARSRTPPPTLRC